MSPETLQHAGSRIGVLLVNLGTPDSTDYWAIRRYLKEFLSDRRVIEENRLKWWLVLNLIILTVRPGRKGRDYDKIWNKERNESPLKTITRSQSDRLDEMMDKVDKRIRVDWAMRYGNPSIALAAGGARCTELRANSDRAAVSAIRGANDRHSVRRSLSRADAHALSADDTRRGALFRRARLYRRACSFAQRGTGKARLQAGRDHRLLSRDAGGLCRQGRSVLCSSAPRRPCSCARSSSSTTSD